eukprot:gene13036-17472_t
MTTSDHSDLIEYALTNGIVMKRSDGSIGHFPFTLQPYNFPKQLFNRAESLSIVFNKLLDNLTSHPSWIINSLKNASEGDDFTSHLVEILLKTQKQNHHQSINLGINRSDYMLHSVDKNETKLHQVEINTIAASCGPISDKISKMHHLLYSSTHKIPKNDAQSSTVNALQVAHNLYVQQTGSNDAVIIMVVQPNERNFADQRLLHFELLEKYNVTCIRATLIDIYHKSIINEATKELIYDNHPVSIVYFRAGYTPNDYMISGTTFEWDSRLRIEQSIAIKCPNIATHLIGTKKIQQELSIPGILEKLLLNNKNKDNDNNHKMGVTQDEIELLRSCFAGLYSLDKEELDNVVNKNNGDSSKVPSSNRLEEIKLLAINNPDGYVLKPQREGGGNNFYGQEMIDALQTLSEKELAAFILMERIMPPSQPAVMIRDGQALPVIECLCELGIFGAYISIPISDDPLPSQDMTYITDEEECERKMVMNSYIGYVVKVKPYNLNEGGVLSGYAVLSSPNLI